MSSGNYFQLDFADSTYSYTGRLFEETVYQWTGRSSVPMDIICTDNNGIWCEEWQLQGFMYDIEPIHTEIYYSQMYLKYILLFVIAIFAWNVLKSFILNDKN